jgi:hypothetical protein
MDANLYAGQSGVDFAFKIQYHPAWYPAPVQAHTPAW